MLVIIYKLYRQIEIACSNFCVNDATSCEDQVRIYSHSKNHVEIWN